MLEVRAVTFLGLIIISPPSCDLRERLHWHIFLEHFCIALCHFYGFLWRMVVKRDIFSHDHFKRSSSITMPPQRLLLISTLRCSQVYRNKTTSRIGAIKVKLLAFFLFSIFNKFYWLPLGVSERDNFLAIYRNYIWNVIMGCWESVYPTVDNDCRVVAGLYFSRNLRTY
jgi:hypothetical protein